MVGSSQERDEGLDGRVGKYFVCRSVRKEAEEGSRWGASGPEGKWMCGSWGTGVLSASSEEGLDGLRTWAGLLVLLSCDGSLGGDCEALSASDGDAKVTLFFGFCGCASGFSMLDVVGCVSVFEPVTFSGTTQS